MKIGGFKVPGFRGQWRFGGRRGFWIEPFILLLIAEKPSHGYELASKLSEFGVFINGVGQMGNLYRTLAQLESMGLVTTDWDIKASSGPARKVYRITEYGLEILEGYVTELANFKKRIDEFLERYSKLKGN